MKPAVIVPALMAALVPALPGTAHAQDHGQHHAHHHGHHQPSPAEPAPPASPEGPAAAPSTPGNAPHAWAADAIWGPAAMARSRADLRRHHGDFPAFWFQADRAEWQARAGHDAYLWDVQAYSGGPTSKLWLKSEGEGKAGDSPEDAEIQALWSRAVTPWWDLQLGLRQDLTGPQRTHAVIGMQGLAPGMVEVDAALFVSHRGEVTARIEAELDQRVTQRLILQPRAELSLSAQDIAPAGMGAGIDKAEIGLRLRYEIVREFAPYVGVEHSWRLGRGADFARAAGDDASVTSLVAGLRFWF